MRVSKLENLLQETPEAYYWIGFIMADGSFKSSINTITIGLSPTDAHHLEKFCSFVEYKGRRKKLSTVALSNPVVMTYLSENFGFKDRKTYNPCFIPEDLPQDLLLSLFIGYVDGDGTIGFQHGRKDCVLRIKCHSSWLPVLESFRQLVFRYTGVETKEVKLNKQGYAYYAISNNIILKNLKSKAIELKLPVLNRKWDKINLDFTGRYQKARQNEIDVERLLRAGYKNREIAKELKLRDSTVCRIRKERLKI